MPKLYYCHGLIGDPQLIEMYRAALDSVLDGSCSPKNLEKLSGYNVYSLRINDSIRLLLTPHRVRGELSLLVLECTDHYKNSRILKSKGALNHFLEKHADELDAMAADLYFEPLRDPIQLFAAEPAEDAHRPLPLHYFNQDFIQLHEAQETACEMPLPLVVSGGAGTGKTVALLLRAARDNEDRMLYVTQSHSLVKSVKRLWDDQPHIDEQRAFIEFKTYAELLQTAYPNHTLLHSKTDAPAPVDQSAASYFMDWYSKSYIKQASIRRKTDSTPIDPDVVYREIRIGSGYTRAEFIALGKKNTSLSTQEEKEFVYTTFEAYVAHLESQNTLDTSLTKLPALDGYTRIYIDEVNDLSQGQLNSFLSHTGCMYSSDSNQMLFDNISNLSLLLQRLHHAIGREPAHIQLDATFRCAQRIADAANFTLGVKHQILGLADKYELHRMQIPEDPSREAGQVVVIDKTTLSHTDWIKALSNTTTFAIVIPEESWGASLKWLQDNGLSTPLIYTAEQIKGLEYPHVLILDHCSDDRAFANITPETVDRAMNASSESRMHRPKQVKTEANDINVQYKLNRLYVAITRAEQTAIVCNDLNRLNRPFLEGLRGLSQEKVLVISKEDASSSQDWEAHAVKLIAQGKLSQATEIYKTKINDGEKKLAKILTNQIGHPAPEVVITEATPKAPAVTDSSGSTKKNKGKKGKATTTGVIVNLGTKSPSELERLLPQFTFTDFFLSAKQNKLSSEFFHEICRMLLTQPANLDYILSSEIRIKEFISIFKGFALLRQLLLTPLFLMNITAAHTENLHARMGLIKAILEFNPNLACVFTEQSMDYQPLLPLLEQADLWPTDLLGDLWRNLFGRMDQDSQSRTISTFLRSDATRLMFEEALKKYPFWLDILSPDIWFQAFKIVLSYGSSPKDKELLLMFAIKHQRQNGQIMEALFACHVRFDHKFPSLEPVHFAAQHGFADAIPIFKRHRIDLNTLSRSKLTPAMIAVQEGHVHVLRQLAAAGGNLYIPRYDGLTLPCLAVEADRALPALEVLQALGMDLNEPSIDGFTPMAIATERRSLKAIDELYRLGADLNKGMVEYNNSPAYTAAGNGHLDLITKLHACGARLDLPNTEGYTPADNAAQGGHIDVLKYLKHSGVTLPDSTAYFAASFDHCHLFRELQTLGVNIDAATLSGDTATYIAVSKRNIPLLKILKELGADLNKTHVETRFPLICLAAEDEALEILVTLKRLGADLNTPCANETAYTACIIAAQEGSIDTLSTLIQLGADINKPGADGTTPAFIAALKGNLKMLRLLKESGANLDALVSDGSSLAFIAAQEGHDTILQALHQWGVNIQKPRQDGVYPVSIALSQNHLHVLTLFHKLYRNLGEVRFTSGLGLAHQAALGGQTSILLKLYELGLDINTPDTHGATPLDYAILFQKTSVIRALKKNGYTKSPAFQKTRDQMENLLERLVAGTKIVSIEYTSSARPASHGRFFQPAPADSTTQDSSEARPAP